MAIQKVFFWWKKQAAETGHWIDGIGTSFFRISDQPWVYGCVADFSKNSNGNGADDLFVGSGRLSPRIIIVRDEALRSTIPQLTELENWPKYFSTSLLQNSAPYSITFRCHGDGIQIYCCAKLFPENTPSSSKANCVSIDGKVETFPIKQAAFYQMKETGNVTAS